MALEEELAVEHQRSPEVEDISTCPELEHVPRVIRETSCLSVNLGCIAQVNLSTAGDRIGQAKDVISIIARGNIAAFAGD